MLALFAYIFSILRILYPASFLQNVLVYKSPFLSKKS